MMEYVVIPYLSGWFMAVIKRSLYKLYSYSFTTFHNQSKIRSYNIGPPPQIKATVAFHDRLSGRLSGCLLGRILGRLFGRLLVAFLLIVVCAPFGRLFGRLLVTF